MQTMTSWDDALSKAVEAGGAAPPAGHSTPVTSCMVDRLQSRFNRDLSLEEARGHIYPASMSAKQHQLVKPPRHLASISTGRSCSPVPETRPISSDCSRTFTTCASTEFSLGTGSDLTLNRKLSSRRASAPGDGPVKASPGSLLDSGSWPPLSPRARDVSEASKAPPQCPVTPVKHCRVLDRPPAAPRKNKCMRRCDVKPIPFSLELPPPGPRRCRSQLDMGPILLAAGLAPPNDKRQLRSQKTMKKWLAADEEEPNSKQEQAVQAACTNLLA